jgi:hypothetical protein
VFPQSGPGSAPEWAERPKVLQSGRALCRTRTDDPLLTMEVLYRLS